MVSYDVVHVPKKKVQYTRGYPFEPRALREMFLSSCQGPLESCCKVERVVPLFAKRCLTNKLPAPVSTTQLLSQQILLTSYLSVHLIISDAILLFTSSHNLTSQDFLHILLYCQIMGLLPRCFQRHLTRNNSGRNGIVCLERSAFLSYMT